MIRKSTNTLPDADFFLLMKNKDERAFDQLYEDCSALLYGLALKSLRSRTYAEEVTTLTFVRIWKNAELFSDKKKSLKIWIIQNLILATHEFLTSKKMKYDFKMNQFPDFSFDLIKD